MINHVDYLELKRFSIEIVKVHQGLNFTKWTDTPYKKFVNHLYSERAIAKKQKNTIKSDMFKLLMNSSYGKTCEKHHESKHIITSLEKFDPSSENADKNGNEYDSSIKTYEQLKNG